MILSKLVLGGANFGQIYGIDKKKINQQEIKKIFRFFKDKNKKIIIDSSPNYGNCEKILGEIKFQNYLIITKIKNLPKKISEIKRFIENFIYQYKKKTKKNIYAILLHDEMELSNIKRLRYIVKILEMIKKKGIIRKYGFSIYNYNKYKKNILKTKPDILQFPINLIDDRISETDFKILKKRNILLYARSVFLQGLLFKNYKTFPKKFLKFKRIWKEYDNQFKKSGLNKFEACLGKIVSNKYIDKIIISFNSLNQLKEIEKLKKVNKNFFFPKLKKNQKCFLINPYRW